MAGCTFPFAEKCASVASVSRRCAGRPGPWPTIPSEDVLAGKATLLYWVLISAGEKGALSGNQRCPSLQVRGNSKRSVDHRVAAQHLGVHAKPKRGWKSFLPYEPIQPLAGSVLVGEVNIAGNG